jgi:hypothetical protein
MDVAAGDQPVDRHLRAGRSLRVRRGHPLHPGWHLRAVVPALGTPAQPGQHRRPAGVPRVDRRLAPQLFEGAADLVVRDGGERAGLAEVYRLTFNGTIIETGTDSYRLASTRARAEEHAKAT